MIKQILKKLKDKPYEPRDPIEDPRSTDERRVAGEETSEVAKDFLKNIGVKQ